MTRKQEQFQFFYKHAKTQTKRQGRAACARHLAAAERYFYEKGWRIEWHHELDAGVVNHTAEDGVETCEFALLLDADSNILASRGCIDNADSDYKRLIRAELALEAMENDKDTQRYGLIA
jgi:hypothetical protein